MSVLNGRHCEARGALIQGMGRSYPPEPSPNVRHTIVLHRGPHIAWKQRRVLRDLGMNDVEHRALLRAIRGAALHLHLAVRRWLWGTEEGTCTSAYRWASIGTAPGNGRVWYTLIGKSMTRCSARLSGRSGSHCRTQYCVRSRRQAGRCSSFTDDEQSSSALVTSGVLQRDAGLTPFQ